MSIYKVLKKFCRAVKCQLPVSLFCYSLFTKILRRWFGRDGAAVFINGGFVCLDAFDSQASLQKLYKKMVESYAFDALEVAGREAKKIDEGVAQDLLATIASAEPRTYPSLGFGEDLRISTKGLTGSCLTLDGRVIHLALFPRAGEEPERRTLLNRPSRRRIRI